MKLKAYLSLMRPANIVTAIGDILAGIVAGYGLAGEVFPYLLETPSTLFLVLSTIGLYGGGVVLNDYFDLELDKIERPERALPSGRIPPQHAALLGTGLLGMGIVFAFLNSLISGGIALAVAILATVYDKWGKHHPLIGPLNMGLCRGGNLLLGVSIAPAAFSQLYGIALIPIVFIGAITLIGREEVHGGKRPTLLLGMLGYIFVLAGILSLNRWTPFQPLAALPFMALFAYMVFSPLIRALAAPEDPLRIRAAVRGGILALIPLNAGIAAGFGGWEMGLFLISLLPLSLLLAKAFAVT